MNLSLYIHVPFCRCKCHWCAFASEIGNTESELWLERILDQLQSTFAGEHTWKTVYLGGGTPTMLSAGQLERLLRAVFPQKEPGAEVTFEANPESLTSGHLEVFEKWGGTRLSLGIQTYDEEILARHGRPTRRKHLDRALALSKEWTGLLSLDLICGLPGQSSSGQIQDIKEALTWNPDHVSFYPLVVEPETPLDRSLGPDSKKLAADEETVEWWFRGSELLENANLKQYEVSNFAGPGAQCRHNGAYWAMEPWWGLGPSATSFLSGSGGGFYYSTEPSKLTSWLADSPPEVEIPSPLEMAKDTLLAGLRRTTGVERRSWADILPQTLELWTGRVVVTADRLFLSREAFPFLDAFLRQAFAELDSRPEFL